MDSAPSSAVQPTFLPIELLFAIQRQCLHAGYMDVRAVAFAVAFAAAAFAAARFCCCPLGNVMFLPGDPGSIPGLGVFCVADFSLFTPSCRQLQSRLSSVR